MKRLLLFLLPAIAVLITVLCFLPRHQEQEAESLPMPAPRSWSQIRESDTLRVITIKSSFTAFSYNGKWYGYEYEKASQLADSLNLKLDVRFLQSEMELADSLFSGAADLAIWPSSKTVFDTIAWLLPVGPRWEAEQVMVSARRLKPIAAGDTTTHYQLAMIEGSRQWNAYHDDSVRAYYDFSPFVIDTIPSDSLTTEKLADALIEGRTDMVMFRSNLAQLLKDYYPTLRLSEPLPYSNDSVAWSIAAGSDTLAAMIDSICGGVIEVPHYSVTQKRLYEQSFGRHRSKVSLKLVDGALSPYDAIFRQYAEEIGWDWRLLAAIAYIESKLDHTQISVKGPLGLMQLMPATVRALGYTEEEVIDPGMNVKVATTLLGRLITTLRNKLPNATESDLIQFTLAGYNAGLGHVYDAIYLADTLGYDTQVWANNVEHCLRLKSDPDYYSYPNVKLGRFNGAFTINYISEVLSTYESFCSQVALADPADIQRKRKDK